jgi:hypothetical protein
LPVVFDVFATAKIISTHRTPAYLCTKKANLTSIAKDRLGNFDRNQIRLRRPWLRDQSVAFANESKFVEADPAG